ncbi:MAG: hypothetical protein AUG51_22030 [Acidobacteria bacterium 13_1_20CM_3_53_8]|nr:MAG: hypothetical protein AUG51_22030 [Acidobacteria bacterium 13_1_20CM_3_53_8]
MWDDLVIDQTKRTDAGVYVVQPNPDTVIFRWQATTLAGGNPVNFEIELRRDGTFVYRYGDGNENLSPIVGLSLGFPESYVVPSHTHEYWQGGPRLSLTNAQTVTFAKRVIPRSVFQFGQDNFRVSESAGSVTVTVTKPVFASGLPAIGTFSLNYATSAGTARPGSDYVETSGTLTFDGGDFRSFTVPIINDNNIEPDETINITLSNPTNGSALGSRSTALITILNDDYGGPSQTQFSNATYTASESAGNARMTVVRSGDTSGPATVLYTTSDGSAQQRADYTVNAGLLNFSPGETSKSFNVLITDDAFPEGDETVALALSNPVGTSLGAQSTATLTITDNDTSTATSNPIDDARLFVQQHYLDFLNRVPDDGGLSYWTGQITQCGTDQNCINSRRVGVSAAYFIELEFQETGSYVYRLYKASYGQRPGYAKFMPDRSRVVGGANLESGKQDFAETFVQRPEFTAKYPLKLSAGEFVDALISAVQQDSGLSLQGKRNELVVEYIVGTNQTNSRALVLRKLIEYPEFASAEYNRAFVLMQYFGYLRRDADAGGYQFWLDVLNNRVPNDASGYRSMVCAFITSAEYQQRFSPIVTRNDHICGSINP